MRVARRGWRVGVVVSSRTAGAAGAAVILDVLAAPWSPARSAASSPSPPGALAASVAFVALRAPAAPIALATPASTDRPPPPAALSRFLRRFFVRVKYRAFRPGLPGLGA